MGESLQWIDILLDRIETLALAIQATKSPKAYAPSDERTYSPSDFLGGAV